MKTCEHCGAGFKAQLPQKRFCSERCQIASQAARRAAKRKRDPQASTCEYCKTTFLIGRKHSRFCSDSCRNADYRAKDPEGWIARKRAWYAKDRLQKNRGPQTKTCEWCGDAYVALKSNGRYCSPACGNASYRAIHRERLSLAMRGYYENNQERFAEYRVNARASRRASGASVAALHILHVAQQLKKDEQNDQP